VEIEPKTDYKPTLNITLSDKDPNAFPQRGNLPTRELDWQARWKAMDLYRLSLEKPAPNGEFTLHDGPPYSNGDIHLGHALNKTAKDITTRYKTMNGFRAAYVPGWDNHGMPIENAVAKKFREAKQQVDRVTLRKACREYAKGWVETQRQQFRRLGIRGDWDDPYLTMSSDFEAKIVEVFGELAEAGYIYRGLKPVFWCGTCETALADAEVEYESHVSNSIYVRFPLLEDAKNILSFSPLPSEARTAGRGVGGEGMSPNTYVVIWTTTPWTIPANLAVAVHPEEDYLLVGMNEDAYLIAEPLAVSTLKLMLAGSLPEGESLADVATLEELGEILSVDLPVLRRLKGAELEGVVFAHPLFGRPSPVVLADYVTMDTGTGIVHTAPGHGKEDFETGQKYGLETLNPVANDGRYTAQAGNYSGIDFTGLRVTQFGNDNKKDSEANTALIEALQKSGNLLHHSKYEHSYPHCWRCHSPLIYRATVQWFMNIDHKTEGETGLTFREKALQAIQTVEWVPRESVNRITSMVNNRPDWCVSRQRAWGVGIPAFYCDTCGNSILTKESVAAVVTLVRTQSSDAWYSATPEEILPPGFQCPHCKGGIAALRKETDVLDVWFDSGSTSRAVLEDTSHWKNLTFPAAVYLEGGDQHRGWFNSSLMISVATKGVAPYRKVVTNGWTLDEKGEAFSKSKGNGVNPLKVIEQYGADVVRMWVVSQDFKEDNRCGESLLKQVGEMYRRVRNTFRFLINNLYDFDPSQNGVQISQMLELDRWALEQLNLQVKTCTEAYEDYDFHKVYQSILNFFGVELSAFYLDVLKDRLYASAANSVERRSAQTALFVLAETLARLLAPVLVHTSEEVFDFLYTEGKANKPLSVHLTDFPTFHEPDTALLLKWEPVLTVRETVNKALEEARQAETIKKPLEAKVTLSADMELYAKLEPLLSQLPGLFLVSQVALNHSVGGGGLTIEVSVAEGVKCARCWLIKTDVGVDASYPDICGRCATAIA